MTASRAKRHKKLDKYEVIQVKAKIEPKFFKNACQSPSISKKPTEQTEEKKKSNCAVM